MEVERDGERLALKVVFAEDRELFERFEREVRALGSVDHPNVVRLLEHGSYRGGLGWLLMPLLRGTTLRMRLVERKRPGVARTCRLFSQFARGLGALHAAGLVHRDVQPSNLFVGSERVGRARGIVLDLGRTLHREHGSASTGSHLAGVLPYLAPEQLLGGAVDARTDLFSLGLCLYETLTGTPASSHDDPYRLLDRGVPPIALEGFEYEQLGRVVERATRLAPEERFVSARALAEALDACAERAAEVAA